MVDPEGMTGFCPSVDVDDFGEPSIASVDITDHPVERLRLSERRESTWSTETLATAEGIWCPTVRIEGARTVVVYPTYTPWHYELRIAERRASGWSFRTIHPYTTLGHSVAVLEDGRIAVAFSSMDEGYDGVLLAVEDGPRWEVAAVVPATGYTVSAHAVSLAYWNGTFAVGYVRTDGDRSADVVIVTKRGLEWETEVVIENEGGGYPGDWLSFDSQGRLHAAFSDRAASSLRYASEAGGWKVEEVARGPMDSDIVYFSLAVDSDDRPSVAYRVSTGSQFTFARRGGGGWEYSLINSTINVGFQPALAFDRQGHPHIAYHNAGWPRQTYDLWYATTRPPYADQGAVAAVTGGPSIETGLPEKLSASMNPTARTLPIGPAATGERRSF